MPNLWVIYTIAKYQPLWKTCRSNINPLNKLFVTSTVKMKSWVLSKEKGHSIVHSPFSQFVFYARCPNRVVLSHFSASRMERTSLDQGASLSHFSGWILFLNERSRFLMSWSHTVLYYCIGNGRNSLGISRGCSVNISAGSYRSSHDCSAV